LDTHTFIWLDNDPDRLSSQVFALCADKNHELLLSMASIWEMQIKLLLGKLTLPLPLAAMIAGQQLTNRLKILPIEIPHILELAALPDYHKDPFDRMLIAQTRVEGLTLLTDDAHIAKYPVAVVW